MASHDRPLPPELDDDPVWQAALRAPAVEESPDEKAIVDFAMSLGGFVDGAEVTAEVLGRREAECATGK